MALLVFSAGMVPLVDAVVACTCGRSEGMAPVPLFSSLVVYDFVLLQFRDIRLVAFFCLFRLFFGDVDLLAPILVVLVVSCNMTFQFLYSSFVVHKQIFYVFVEHLLGVGFDSDNFHLMNHIVFDQFAL